MTTNYLNIDIKGQTEMLLAQLIINSEDSQKESEEQGNKHA